MVRIGAVILLREDGALLLQLRDDKPGLRAAGQWVPPGGHCEEGESIEECARREFLEETLYWCDKLKHVATIINDFEKGWPAEELTVFRAEYDGVQQVQCLEGQDLRFIEREKAAEYAVPDYIVAIWDAAIV